MQATEIKKLQLRRRYDKLGGMKYEDRQKVTVQEIIDALRSEIRNGELDAGSTRPLIVALRRVYEDTSEDGNLDNVAFDEDDFEQRLQVFDAVSSTRFGNRATVVSYKARARKAIRAYRESREVKLRYERGAKERIGIYDRMMEFMKQAMITQIRRGIYDDRAMREIDIYPFPAHGDKMAAIIIPKGATAEDLQRGAEFLHIFARIKMREKNAK